MVKRDRISTCGITWQTAYDPKRIKSDYRYTTKHDWTVLAQ